MTGSDRIPCRKSRDGAEVVSAWQRLCRELQRDPPPEVTIEDIRAAAIFLRIEPEVFS